MYKRSNLLKDNRGIALISVMICATLCLLLSATILRVSLLSYRQKAISKQAASTFYENEAYFDDIKMGLQAKVATALGEATTTSRTNFVTEFKKKLLADGAGVTGEKAKIEKALYSYITGYNAGSLTDDIVITVEGETVGGVTTYIDDTTTPGELVIKNVKIRYTDLERGGYISEIKTDIRIRSPYVSEDSSGGSGGYSMFAGGGFSIDESTSKPAVLHMEGDIYVGYDNGDSRKVVVNTKKGTQDYSLLTNAMASEWKKDVCIQWEKSSNITVNGDVYIRGNSKLVILSGNVDVRGKIYVSNNSQLIVASTAKLKCQDIVLNFSGTNYSGGDAISDGYDSSTIGKKKFTSLPKPADSNTQSNWWYDGRVYDGLFIWNGSEAQRIYKITTDLEEVKAKVTKYNSDGQVIYKANGERDKEEVEYKVQHVKKLNCTYGNSQTASWCSYTTDQERASSCIILDESNFPDKMVTKKIDGVNYDFDVEFLNLVDVEYYIRGTKDKNWIDNAHRLTNHPTTTDGAKWNAPYTESSSATGRRLNFKKKDGSTIQVLTEVGQVETGNSGCHFFMPYYGHTITFNDQNSNQNSWGIYISPGKIIGTAREQNSYIKSLLSLVDDNYDNAKEFFDAIGQTVLVGSADKKYRVVNNMFNQGIKVFYTDSSSGGGTGGQTVTDADKLLNGTLEIITFENWEKNPLPIS